MDRRSFIGWGTLAMSTVVGSRIARAFGDDGKPAPGATVTTTAGKVRGTVEDKVQVFKGVPYAASTAGANRFMPPAKRASWTGVRDCFELGLRAPQLVSAFHGQVPPEFESMDRDEPMGEDCLVLNIWTPGVGAGQKRPVMVWLHGGGYTSGSGGFVCYDGTQLAKKHDVVAISLNHRLTAFGYLYLAGIGGEKYADSSNLGNLDIIAALDWIRDNIAAFGGDPGNVTIYGQSGGAGKVSSLMAMPAAKGLFHRAIVQSGAAVKGVSREAANKSTETFLAKLNLKPDQVDQLQTLSVDQLLAATTPAGMPGPPGLALAPVVDGHSLPTDPFDPAASEVSAGIPLLIGTVEDEVAFFPNQILDPIDDASLHAHVKQVVRNASDAQVDKLIAAYREGRPGASNTDLFLVIASDATFRAGVLTEADRKAVQGKGAVYQYYFTWKSPVRDGKLRAFHTIEIPFVFDNVDAARSMIGSGADRYALAERMSSAWVSFARTGNPNTKLAPHWDTFDTSKRAVMVINDEWKLVDDPHGEEQRLLHSIQAQG
ncbi:MAG TPA: carboxylesterase family protein [Candidatus Acidoferrales bacterium]|nr:carboxylesterase family protein [Candidatus Acidoferrales bacterium]